MRIALLGRNKLGLVDGTCKRQLYQVVLLGRWERENAIVLSWLMNSVASDLIEGVVYASNAHVVWEYLTKIFDKIDDSRTYNLHQEISQINQGI